MEIEPFKPFDSIKDIIPHIPYTEQDWFLITEALKRFQVSRKEMEQHPHEIFRMGIELEDQSIFKIFYGKTETDLQDFFKQFKKEID